MKQDTLSIEYIEKIEDFCLMAVDKSGKIVAYSKGCEHIEEMKREDVIGKSPADLYDTNYPIDPHNPNEYADVDGISLILDTLHNGKVYNNFFCYYKTPKGKACNILYNAFPVYDKNGNIKMGICTYREMSDYLNLISIINKQQSDIKKLAGIKLHNGTQYTFDNALGVSPEMHQCLMQAKIAAGSNASVLISGATGTGKEVIAQSIHNASLMTSHQFVAVNCSAIPETLLESTLFGTCSGSFTGAKDKKGLFEEAEGGTLFLDEINSMNISLQSKLLRVLEMQKFMKIGSTKEINCNVRIISALNEDPVTAINEKRLRADLFYRLAVFHIHIPSLKNRKADILELSKHFICEVSSYLNKKAMTLTDQSKKLFLKYTWPGNIRELKHVITQAIYMVDSHIQSLDVDCFPHFLTEKEIILTTEQPLNVTDDLLPLRERLNALEEEIIITTLNSNNGNISKTARDLKISRQNLQNKLKKYHLQHSS
ncbi:MAG: sigma 54-interacting transcriptional regulator [Eubacterium sp.]